MAEGAKSRKRVIYQRTRAGYVFGIAGNLGKLIRMYGETDKESLHEYSAFYERHVGPFRFRSNRVLEIGVGGDESIRPGGSLRIWRDYLVRSIILGLDIHEKEVSLGSRVKFYRGDQSEPDDLDGAIALLGGVPNIVIDDGSHVGDHIWTTFAHIWPILPANSVYVIEDLSTSYYPSYGGGIPRPHRTGVGLLSDLIDAVQARDPTFHRRPSWGDGPTCDALGAAELHIYPGIAFLVKRDF